MGVLSSFNSACQASKPKQDQVYTPLNEPSAIIAIAFVEKGYLPAVGATTGSGPSAISNTPAGIVDAIRKAELLGKATVFPAGTVNGKKALPTENPSSFMAGNQDEPDIASVTNEIEVMWRDSYTERNTKYLNSLRGNHTDKDVYYFTKNSYSPVIVNGINVSGVGSTIEGDKKKDITGGLKVKWTVMPNVGEPVPYFGVTTDGLSGYAKLTFAAPTVSGGVTAGSVSCEGYLKFNASSTAGTITFAVAETTTCLDWGIWKDCNSAIPGGEPVTISNGVITVGTGLAAGTYKYTVVAKNTLGHEAIQTIEITKAA